jgi:hypothetical protein
MLVMCCLIVFVMDLELNMQSGVTGGCGCEQLLRWCWSSRLASVGGTGVGHLKLRAFFVFLEKPFRPHLNVRISHNLAFTGSNTAAPLFVRHMNWTAEM